MLHSIREVPLPEDAQIAKIKNPVAPASIDCFTVNVPGNIALKHYIEAFYTTPIFKLERRILSIFLNKPSNDVQAKELANQARETFAAWVLEYRDDQQVILGDYMGRTKSWLMVKHLDNKMTQLFFGTAVMPIVTSDGTTKSPSILFNLLGGFHHLYSKLLLRSALVALDQ